MSKAPTGFVVSLADGVYPEDARKITDAIRIITGVVSVDPIGNDVFIEHIVRARTNSTWVAELLALMEKMR